MILITTYYKSDNEERQKEIDECLIHNNNNVYISKIYLLNNRLFDLDFIADTSKIIQIIISIEPSYILKYNDAINFININLKREICILSNSDIYFDKTLNKIGDITDRLYALLRYDKDSGIFSRYNIPRNDSQDSWIFRAPLNIDLNRLDFSLGTLGCDNIFANIVYESGIDISNPAFDIITTHVHKTEYRTYNIYNRIYGKYCLLTPCHLGETPIISQIDY